MNTMATTRSVLQSVVFCCAIYYVFAKSANPFFDEPVCSKFHFEEKVLEKLVRLDFRVEQTSESVNENISILKDKDKELKIALDMLEEGQDKKRNDLKTELDAEMLALKDELAQLKTERPSKGVAFVARNPPTSLPFNALVRFHTAVLNIGDAYDYSTGRFTAPVSGIYLFTAQFCTKSQNAIAFQVMVNDNTLGVSRQYEADYNGVCSSMTTVGTMQAGEQAWIKCVNNAVVVIADDDSWQWNMFTAVLISPN